jgi:hypothetical protein
LYKCREGLPSSVIQQRGGPDTPTIITVRSDTGDTLIPERIYKRRQEIESWGK